MNKYSKLAIELAKLSEHRVKVGAVLLSGNSIIATGINSTTKSHPLQKYYNDTYRNFDVEIHHYIHAEIDALLKYRRMRIQLPKLKLYIARLRQNNTLVAGMPCPGCMGAILDNGVSEIIYSTQQGFESRYI